MDPITEHIIKIQHWGILIFVGLFILLIIICGTLVVKLEKGRIAVTCKTLGSYDEAQKLLHSYPHLDGDSDGIACENLR